jgi:glycosyltransferase involved in cell wall biosynthesis
LLSIAKYYDKNKYRLIIITFAPHGHFHDLLAERQIPFYALPAGNPGFWEILKQIPAFIRILRKERVDVLHLHTFWVSFWGVFCAKLLGINKVFITRHHADYHIKLGKKLLTQIDAWSAKNAKKAIAVSNFTKKIMVEVEKVPDKKVIVIHNAIEPLQLSKDFDAKKLKSEFGIKANDFVLLCISRIHPDKNIPLLLHGVAEIKKTISVKLLVAGAGTDTGYYAELVNLTLKLDLANNVDFLGFRTDIADLLEVSNCLVVASFEHSESFGFANLEAMSKGKPILTSKIGPFIEVCGEEVPFYFDPYSLESFIEAFYTMYNNPIEVKKRADAGLKRFYEFFQFENMIKKYEAVYES